MLKTIKSFVFIIFSVLCSGLFGQGEIGSGGTDFGLKGRSYYNYGVIGSSNYSAGVMGSGYYCGVYGTSVDSDGKAVYGKTTSHDGYAVYGESNSGYGLYGVSSTGYAIYGEGSVFVEGNTNLDGNVFVGGFIQGTQTGGALRILSSSENSYIDIGSQNDSWAHIYSNRNFIFNTKVYSQTGFSSYSTNPLRLMTNGTTRLEINASTGKSYFKGDVYLPVNKSLILGNSSTSGLRIFTSSTYSSHFIDLMLGHLYFRNGSNCSMIMQNNGSVAVNVGIDYSDPDKDYAQGYQLAVNGKILCEEMKVINDVPASDYVFDNDYNLLSLDEVEQYVKEHKHLPETPSAKEFKENGYKVGEMDDLLLRKIEELTLYVIELNRKLENVNKMNDELINEISNLKSNK